MPWEPSLLQSPNTSWIFFLLSAFDMNNPEGASDSTGLRAQSYKTVLIWDASSQAPGPQVTSLSDLTTHMGVPATSAPQVCQKSSQKSGKHFIYVSWFIIKYKIQGQPNGRAAQGQTELPCYLRTRHLSNTLMHSPTQKLSRHRSLGVFREQD